MSEKRKDNKGRLLRTGESQRKDLSYMYRYKDNDGSRKSVYAPTLAELREKEDEIAEQLRDGVIAGKKLTVIELVDQYLATKRSIKPTTMGVYQVARNHIANSYIALVDIRDITRSAAKRYYLALNDGGLKYSSVHGVSNLLKPAFRQAVEDDLLTKNVFDFSLTSLIRNDMKKRTALSEEDMKDFLEFVRTDPKSSRHYDLVMLLAYTGIRASEACGLTIGDIDFANNRISIDRQTVQTTGMGRYIQTPKTKTSVRCIPINPALRDVLRHTIRTATTRKVQPIIGGVSGFLFVTKHGNICTSDEVSTWFEQIVKRYYKAKPQQRGKKITAHVLRHTFCTRCIENGLDVKSTQYFMGHATAAMTMNVYAHVSYSSAERAFQKIYGT